MATEHLAVYPLQLLYDLRQSHVKGIRGLAELLGVELTDTEISTITTSKFKTWCRSFGIVGSNDNLLIASNKYTSIYKLLEDEWLIKQLFDEGLDTVELADKFDSTPSIIHWILSPL